MNNKKVYISNTFTYPIFIPKFLFNMASTRPDSLKITIKNPNATNKHRQHKKQQHAINTLHGILTTDINGPTDNDDAVDSDATVMATEESCQSKSAPTAVATQTDNIIQWQRNIDLSRAISNRQIQIPKTLPNFYSHPEAAFQTEPKAFQCCVQWARACFINFSKTRNLHDPLENPEYYHDMEDPRERRLDLQLALHMLDCRQIGCNVCEYDKRRRMQRMGLIHYLRCAENPFNGKTRASCPMCNGPTFDFLDGIEKIITVDPWILATKTWN